MKGSFTVAAGALAPAVRYVARHLSPKPAVPVWGGLLFDVPDDGRLVISGMSENVTASAAVPIEGGAAGRFVVAGRLVDHLVATFPDKPVAFEQHDSTVTVTCGSWRGTLPAMSEDDYPALAGRATLAGVVSGSDLADAVRRVGSAAARDSDGGVVYTGIHLSFDEDFCIPLSGGGEPARSLTLTATDRYRAARQSIRWEPGGEVDVLGDSALLMAGELVNAIDAFADADQVEIGSEGGSFSLTTPTRSLVVRTLGDGFPIAGLIPIFAQESSGTAELSAKSLLDPLKRADLLKNKDSDMVTLRFSENLLILSAGSDGSGDGDEEIEIAYEGEDRSVMVRSAALRGGLDTAPSDTVALHFGPSEYRPILYTSPADGTWRYLTVPLRHAGGSK